MSVYKTGIEKNEGTSAIRCKIGKGNDHHHAKHCNLGTLVNVVSAGDCIGERHVMNGSPRSASAVARDEVEVLVFCAQRFKEIVTNAKISLVAQPEAIKRILNSGFISRTKDDISLLMGLAESSTVSIQAKERASRMEHCS